MSTLSSGHAKREDRFASRRYTSVRTNWPFNQLHLPFESPGAATAVDEFDVFEA